MLAIIVCVVVRIERDKGGQDVCDFREARRRGWRVFSADGGAVVFGSLASKVSVRNSCSCAVSSSSASEFPSLAIIGAAVNEYRDNSWPSVMVRT